MGNSSSRATSIIKNQIEKSIKQDCPATDCSNKIGSIVISGGSSAELGQQCRASSKCVFDTALTAVLDAAQDNKNSAQAGLLSGSQTYSYSDTQNTYKTQIEQKCGSMRVANDVDSIEVKGGSSFKYTQSGDAIVDCMMKVVEGSTLGATSKNTTESSGFLSGSGGIMLLVVVAVVAAYVLLNMK